MLCREEHKGYKNPASLAVCADVFFTAYMNRSKHMLASSCVTPPALLNHVVKLKS